MTTMKSRLAVVAGLAVAVVTVWVAAVGGVSAGTSSSMAREPATHVGAPAGGGSPGATTAVSQPGGASQTAGPPASLVGSFKALRRPAQAGDALPASADFGRPLTATGAPNAQDGIKPELSRLVGRPGGKPVWIVPGVSGVCIVLSEGGAACGPALGGHGAERVGIFMALVPVNGDPPTGQGILPDGATIDAVDKDGKPVAGLAISGQAYSLPAGTASFTLHLEDGTTDTETLPTARPPAAP